MPFFIFLIHFFDLQILSLKLILGPFLMLYFSSTFLLHIRNINCVVVSQLSILKNPNFIIGRKINCSYNLLFLKCITNAKYSLICNTSLKFCSDYNIGQDFQLVNHKVHPSSHIKLSPCLLSLSYVCQIFVANFFVICPTPYIGSPMQHYKGIHQCYLPFPGSQATMALIYPDFLCFVSL